MKLGFIGIGRMGSRMARRLVAAGHDLAIYDVNRAACAPLEALGAKISPGPDAVARESAIILDSVPGPKEVEAAMGLALEGVRPGALVIETSTIGPAQSRALAQRFAVKNASFIDAAVSGGVKGAEDGTLTAMVGASPEAFERALPVLQILAANIHHMGPVGSGDVAKLINQMIYLSYAALFCEGARLGRRAGLDVPELVRVLRRSVAGAPLMTGWDKRIEAGDTRALSPIHRMLKDLELGAELCADTAFDAPIFAEALAAYRGLKESGEGGADMTALYSLLD